MKEPKNIHRYGANRPEDVERLALFLAKKDFADDFGEVEIKVKEVLDVGWSGLEDGAPSQTIVLVNGEEKLLIHHPFGFGHDWQ